LKNKKNFSAEIDLNGEKKRVRMGEVGVLGDDENKRHTAPVMFFFGQGRVLLNNVPIEEVYSMWESKSWRRYLDKETSRCR
jgi:hypothetical protein